MKRIVVLAIACAFAPLAGADLYKYVDKDGKTVYSDQPPANVESQQLHVNTGVSTSSGGAKSAVERDKELEKGREAARDKAKKADAEANNAKVAEQKCAAAQATYKTYQDGGKLFRYTKDGERELLNDDEIEAKRKESKQDMDEACKKS
jgi:hypothetical protein